MPSLKNIKLFILISLLTFLHSLSFGQSWLWAREASSNYNGGEIDPGDHCVAIDKLGNVFYTGMFGIDTLAFGPFTLRSDTTYNIFVVKYDKNGNVKWARQSKTPIQNYNNYAYGYSMTVDEGGSAIVAGYFKGTVVFGYDTLRSSTWGEIFIAKYDSAGNFIWAKQSKESANAVVVANSIVVDKNGNCYVTGWFQDTAFLGTYTLTNVSTMLGNVFLVKYDSYGNILWAKQSIQASASTGGIGTSIALNRQNGVYITGYFINTLSFSPFTLRSISTNGDCFIVKYDTLGNVIWAKQSNSVNHTSYSSATSISIDGNGFLYMTGGFSDTVSFNKDTLGYRLPANENDAFLAKYDSNGNAIWA